MHNSANDVKRWISVNPNVNIYARDKTAALDVTA